MGIQRVWDVLIPSTTITTGSSACIVYIIHIFPYTQILYARTHNKKKLTIQRVVRIYVTHSVSLVYILMICGRLIPKPACFYFLVVDMMFLGLPLGKVFPQVLPYVFYLGLFPYNIFGIPV